MVVIDQIAVFWGVTQVVLCADIKLLVCIHCYGTHMIILQMKKLAQGVMTLLFGRCLNCIRAGHQLS
jgi:hypothetical protein